jgi:hypothetical protein
MTQELADSKGFRPEMGFSDGNPTFVITVLKSVITKIEIASAG